VVEKMEKSENAEREYSRRAGSAYRVDAEVFFPPHRFFVRKQVFGGKKGGVIGNAHLVN
jgi:hypothetical protein